MAFWRKLVEIMGTLDCERSRADPSSCYKWTLNSIMLWLSWIDDCIYCGKEKEVQKMKVDFMSQLDCEDSGKLNEHVDVKIGKGDNEVKLAQPVLI